MASKVTLLTKHIIIRLHRIPKIVAWIFPRRIWFAPNDNVCLTFDDGPHPETTPWLLAFLKKHNIQATFFWQGEKIKENPALYQKAISEGHVVGHHGYVHVSAKQLSFERFCVNFDQSQTLVNSTLFRPPHGRLNRKQANYVMQKGTIVMWSWMSYDFDTSLSADAIIQKATKQIRNRDILVFHENEKSKDKLKQIIPAIIKVIRDKQLNFALVEKKQ